MGICAGAGYSANAAINDRRIKALGMVSAVNIGQMFRNGWDNNVKDADAVGYLDFAPAPAPPMPASAASPPSRWPRSRRKTRPTPSWPRPGSTYPRPVPSTPALQALHWLAT